MTTETDAETTDDLTERESMLARVHANLIVAKMMVDHAEASLIAASGPLDPLSDPEGGALPLLSDASVIARHLKAKIEEAQSVLTRALAAELVAHANRTEGPDLRLVEDPA